MMPKEYKVQSIDELTRISETGGIERYYRHWIKTAGGVRLSVNVSEEDFTAEKAAPILLSKAQEADKIMKL